MLERKPEMAPIAPATGGTQGIEAEIDRARQKLGARRPPLRLEVTRQRRSSQESNTRGLKFDAGHFEESRQAVAKRSTEVVQ